MQTNNAKVHSSEAIPSVVGCPKCGSKDWGYCGVVMYWKEDLADSICKGCGQRFVSRYRVDFSFDMLMAEIKEIAMAYIRGNQQSEKLTMEHLNEAKKIYDAYQDSLKTVVIASN